MQWPDAEHYVIRAQKAVVPGKIEAHDIVVKDGVIKAVEPLNSVSDLPIVETGELVLMAGLVDSHVHINEPGRTEWEGFTTATQGAVAGGITTVCDMPLNCTPVTTSLSAFETKRAVLEGQLWADCGFYGGIVPGNENEIEPMIEAGVLGFKCFLIHSGIDDFPNVTEEDLRKAMPILARHNVPLLVHAELCSDLNTPQWVGNQRAYNAYLASRPRQWELDAIELMIKLCREFRGPVHIVHLSCADALPAIKAAKEEGLPITVETCSHYLTLSSETIPEGDTRFKCAPPIREHENAERLWKGLKEGLIDFIVSDHSPCTPELKKLETGHFDEAWGGISSLQFGLPIVWSEAKKHGFNINDIARLQCREPARFIGQGHKKGRIVAGFDADFVLWDPNEYFSIEPRINRHRHKATPYDGKIFHGTVHATILRGKPVYMNFKFPEEAPGQALLQRSDKGLAV